MAERLTIQHSELGELRNPVLIRVTVENSGRVDLASDRFDGGQPLRLDLGSAILEQLDTANNRPAQPIPSTTAHGTALLLGPGRIGRGQSITYACLVDGPVQLRVTHALVDVDIRGRAAEPTFPVPASRDVFLFATLTLLFMVLMILAVYSVAGLANVTGLPNVDTTRSAPEWVLYVALAIALVAMAAVLKLVVVVRHRKAGRQLGVK
jgi:hypothetical protein